MPTDYTPATIATLSGRELDRAVEGIVFKRKPILRTISTDRPFSTDLNLIPLAFAEGGPLEPRRDCSFRIHIDCLGLNDTTPTYAVWSDSWKDFEKLATGPDIQTAIWRSACVVALERKRHAE